MALWDRDLVDRQQQADNALSLGIIRELAGNHRLIVTAAISQLTGNASLETSSPEQAFRSGYELALGISSIAIMLNATLIAYGEVAGGRWREEARDVIDTLTRPEHGEDAIATLRAQDKVLARADRLLEALEVVLRERALSDPLLGSGKFARDEDLRNLLARENY
jgi:hypothetical protein